MSRTFVFLVIILLFSLSSPILPKAAEDLPKAVEDPVIKTLNEAVQHYKNGKFSAAVTSLDYASQMIRQKRGEALGKLLPAPLDGWTAEQADSKAMGSAMFGGSTTAERHYIKAEETITVKYSTDSPMMQSRMMMFTNPVFASSSGKIELINGQKAIVEYSKNSGTINIVIGNNLLVTIEGSNVKREDLMAYASKINMEKLTKLP